MPITPSSPSRFRFRLKGVYGTTTINNCLEICGTLCEGSARSLPMEVIRCNCFAWFGLCSLHFCFGYRPNHNTTTTQRHDTPPTLSGVRTHLSGWPRRRGTPELPLSDFFRGQEPEPPPTHSTPPILPTIPLPPPSRNLAQSPPLFAQTGARKRGTMMGLCTAIVVPQEEKEGERGKRQRPECLFVGVCCVGCWGGLKCGRSEEG